ncbi:hypothetical protein QFZ47_001989 [Variovorax paradoxus]|nr:hypothetical protein [Variovorax paradoxus]
MGSRMTGLTVRERAMAQRIFDGETIERIADEPKRLSFARLAPRRP